ncbi:hypothetical protein EJ04DRAFT_561549 [Polyplosphaeria fusca]|uniref:Uncharacterized protein n=1 Tax=Polyplosphaeria fusca TaxID=682080 RepID=A0A9P4V2G7_9PLEO|nr:hypothetical protein EJ04DRAFT_561549 [Polyplosphaeria fusca]
MEVSDSESSTPPNESTQGYKPQPSSRLLSLPGELRNHIYDFAVEDEPIPIYLPKDLHRQPDFCMGPSFPIQRLS